VSAFKGANVIDGRLGAFIAEVEAGRIPKGSYLLIESLDRMSRNVISEAQGLLLRILNLDINIVTLLDGQILSKEKYNADGGISVMFSLVQMLRAHEESKTKSVRVTAGWERARKDKAIITRMAPAWLTTDGDKWVVDKEKTKVIKRIFKMSLEGIGTPTIARTLTRDGVPTFGSFEYRWDEKTIELAVEKDGAIDEAQWPTVKQIRKLRADGQSYSEIVRQMVDDDVPRLKKFSLGWVRRNRIIPTGRISYLSIG